MREAIAILIAADEFCIVLGYRRKESGRMGAKRLVFRGFQS